MCIICTRNYDISLTYLNCYKCKDIKEIPKELVNLNGLDCCNTQIIAIPKELINLTYLCVHNTQIKEIPKELTNLTYLFCDGTLIKEIPKEFINLKYFHCIHTQITEIPKELVKLKFVNYIGIIYWDRSWFKTKDEIKKIIKLQKFWKKNGKFIIKLPTLWRIAEYYTKKKYSPKNILKYVDLE